MHFAVQVYICVWLAIVLYRHGGDGGKAGIAIAAYEVKILTAGGRYAYPAGRVDSCGAVVQPDVHAIRCTCIAPYIYIGVLMRGIEVGREVDKGVYDGIGKGEVLLQVHSILRIVAGGAYKYAARACKEVGGLAEEGVTIVRAQCATPAEVDHSRLAHRRCVVKQVVHTVYHIAYAGVYPLQRRWHDAHHGYIALVGKAAVLAAHAAIYAATGCYAGHMAAMRCDGGIVANSLHGVGIGDLLPIGIACGRGAHGLLVPYTLDAVLATGGIVKGSVVVVEAGIYNTHYHVFAGKGHRQVNAHVGRIGTGHFPGRVERGDDGEVHIYIADAGHLCKGFHFVQRHLYGPYIACTCAYVYAQCIQRGLVYRGAYLYHAAEVLFAIDDLVHIVGHVLAGAGLFGAAEVLQCRGRQACLLLRAERGNTYAAEQQGCYHFLHK